MCQSIRRRILRVIHANCLSSFAWRSNVYSVGWTDKFIVEKAVRSKRFIDREHIKTHHCKEEIWSCSKSSFHLELNLTGALQKS